MDTIFASLASFRRSGTLAKITTFMKTLYRSLFILAVPYLLQQCEDTTSTQLQPESEDATTSAAKNDPFILYATPVIFLLIPF
jgi:hypothetical protein